MSASSPNSRVRVLVRCRPFLPSERDHTSTRVRLLPEERKVIVQRSPCDAASRSFAFDRIYPSDTPQEGLMEEVAPLVRHALAGLHATVFAYGQTGSGKTHTVEGVDYVRNHNNVLVPNTKTEPKDHGIVLRSIQLLFDGARERQRKDSRACFRLRCSYYQLYNERVTDLLNPSSARSVEGFHDGGLKIGWTRDNAFRVKNLFLCECDDPEKMRRVYLSGAREKVMGSHAVNKQSSRSHTVFTIYIESCDSDTPECSIRSEFTVVDLAGSEKLSMLSNNPSETLLRESSEINASLLALGKVITALAGDTHKKGKAGETDLRSHIPYRDSKLTKLLKHALGGNCLTTMIACISPVDCYVEETLSTLLYAGRARNIKNVPHVNEDPQSALVRQLRQDVANMSKELAYYRAIAGETLVGKGNVLQQQEAGSDNLQSRNAEGTIVHQTYKGEASDDKKQINELADKLLQACEFLKNIITVNGQLRKAFDSVKGAKTELEQRQVELNAENIALRERIEVLESIALNDDFSTSLNWNSNRQKIQKEYVSVSEPTAAPLLLPRAETSDGVENSKQTLRLSNGKNTLPLNRNNGLSSLSTPLSLKTRSVSASHGSRESPGVKKSLLEQRLNDYTKRYCLPNQVSSYAQYYGRARQQLPKNIVTNAVIDSTEKMIKELPRDFANVVVPQSISSTSQFGALSFAGGESDVAVLEEKRRQRMEKRNALLAQQQALHSSLARAFSSAAEDVQLASIRASQAQHMSPLLYSANPPRGHQTNASASPAAQKTMGHGARRLQMYIKREEANAKGNDILVDHSFLDKQRSSNSRSGNGI